MSQRTNKAAEPTHCHSINQQAPQENGLRGRPTRPHTLDITQPSRQTCAVVTILKASNHQDPSTSTDRCRLCLICCGTVGLCAIVNQEPKSRQIGCLSAAHIHMLSPMLYPTCQHTTNTHTHTQTCSARSRHVQGAQNSAGRRVTPPDQRPCIGARCEGAL